MQIVLRLHLRNPEWKHRVLLVLQAQMHLYYWNKERASAAFSSQYPPTK